MLTPESPVFTLPTNSSINLGLFPAASIRVGFSINVGMAAFSMTGFPGDDSLDAKEPRPGGQVPLPRSMPLMAFVLLEE